MFFFSWKQYVDIWYKAFIKAQNKIKICSRKIQAFLLLGNLLGIDSSFFHLTHCVKILPIHLKQPPFIQNKLFILTSLYRSSDFCFLCVPWLLHTSWLTTSLITVFLAIPLTISITLTHWNLRDFVFKWLKTQSKIREVSGGYVWTWVYFWSLTWKTSSCKHKVHFLHLISHICLRSLWDPLLGAQGIFNPWRLCPQLQEQFHGTEQWDKGEFALFPYQTQLGDNMTPSDYNQFSYMPHLLFQGSYLYVRTLTVREQRQSSTQLSKKITTL